MTTWTQRQKKQGGTSQTWNSASVTWASALYDWDGETATIWTYRTKN